MLTLPVEPSRFAVFLTVMASLAAAPGPANLFSIATGMNSATLVWFVAAAVGLGALIRALPDVFAFLTVAGAVYLIWLGLRALTAAVRGGGAISTGPTSEGSPLAQGFAVQIANPKAVLFFSAVLPPFIDLSRPLVPQLVTFAAATIGLDILTMPAYGLGGVALARRMDAPCFRRLFNTFVGLVLIAAAVLILTRHG